MKTEKLRGDMEMTRKATNDYFYYFPFSGLMVRYL